MEAAGSTTRSNDSGPTGARAPAVTNGPRMRQLALARALGIPVSKELSVADGVVISLVLIPSGVFEAGQGDEEVSPVPDGKVLMPRISIAGAPREGDRVVIKKPFWISRKEITQAQFKAVMNANPSFYLGDTLLPVHCVSFRQAREFSRKVGRITKTTARLPTEGEWEYACRAGSTAAYSTGKTLSRKHARYARGRKITTEDMRRGPLAAGSLLPNAWGVYDMHGNVSEWCVPWNVTETSASSRPRTVQDPQAMAGAKVGALRGGAWCDVAERCHAAFSRQAILIEGVPKHFRCGIRLVVDLPSP